MEQTKKQVDTDTNMAAAMDKISSAQALLSSREEEMEKVAAAKESEYKVAPWLLDDSGSTPLRPYRVKHRILMSPHPG